MLTSRKMFSLQPVQCQIAAVLTLCLTFTSVRSQGYANPAVDPFGPPLPVPPTPPAFPGSPQYYNNQRPQNFGPPVPPPLPRFPPVNNFNSMNTVNYPSLDIGKPMPPEAAAAGQMSYNYGSSSNQPEREFEGDPSPSGSGSGMGQPFNPAPSYGMQSTNSLGGGNTLLDAYYGRGGGGYASRSAPTYRRNNGLFGGLFGNSPMGNLMGAYAINEWVF